MTTSPASMQSGLVIRPSEKALAQSSVHFRRKVTADPALVDRTKRSHILRSHLATLLLLVESGQALGSAYAGGKRLPCFLRSFAGGARYRYESPGRSQEEVGASR